MDSNIATIIVAAISALGSIAGVIISSKGASNNTVGMKKLSKKMDKLEDRMKANDLQTARIDLRGVLEYSRDNIPAVLELARIYFINMHGNADLGRKFLAWVKEYKVEAWAKKHHEDISNLIEAAKHSA